MTRIIAGTVGGRRLETPDGSATRPTTDRVREALFSALDAAMGGIDDVVLLDLFAGSGAIGLESLSRGGARSVLVERDRPTGMLIARNAKALGLSGAEVVVEDAERYVTRLTGQDRFDVVFLDPPYAYDEAALTAVLAKLVEAGCLPDHALVVVERAKRDGEPTWPPGLVLHRRKSYGSTTLWYGRPD